MGTGIIKIDGDEAAYLCVQELLNTIGLSKAAQDEFWTSDKYTDNVIFLSDKCEQLINWYGRGLHVERLAKQSEAIFEVDSKKWAYLPATGAEILFRSRDGFIFSDHMLNNLLRTWMEQSSVLFIEPPNPLYNHPARDSIAYKARIKDASSVGSVKERVDGLGRLIVETPVPAYLGGGVDYSIFDQNGRLVEYGSPANEFSHADKETVTKMEYDGKGNLIMRIVFEDGQPCFQIEDQFNLSGMLIKSIHTDYSTGRPVIEEYDY